MKTSNIEPSGQRAAAATRGSRSTNLAGAKGMVWRDPVTESVGQIRDMTVIGATLKDNEDGTGILTIGAGGLLVPEATITAVEKGSGNPTFNFPCLVENQLKVGSTYYCPYINTPAAADTRMATATSRDGPWTAYGGTPLIALTSISWRGAAAGMYAPEIVEHEGTFYQFYSLIMASGATSPVNAIGVATCATIDGTYVDSGAAVLSPGAAGAWDSRRVGEPSVIFQSGQWVMAYMGEDSDLAYQASEQIGIATAPSPTGPWTKAPGNPLLPLGPSGEWDDGVVADPYLFYADGYYWIWYPGGPAAGPAHGQDVNMGLAYATTPTGTWTRFAGNPVLLNGAAATWDDWWVTRGGMYIENGQWGGVYTGYDGTDFKGGNFRLTIDSGAISVPPTAVDIPITDAGGYYTGTEVESALQEIGATLVTLASPEVGHYEVIVSGTSPPVAVETADGTDWVYGFVPG